MNHNDKAKIPQFERLSNFRDIGGLNTKEGNYMKSGILFRSDALSRISDNDRALIKELNIKVICDLRTAKECSKKPSPNSLKQEINIINIPLHKQETHDINRKQLFNFLFSKSGDANFEEFSRDYYHHIAFDRTAQTKEIITALAHEDSLPALIHCTAGKDRTGYISALIQLLVGVPYETVAKEYLMTNDFYESRMKKLMKIMKWITLFQVPPERLKSIIMAQQPILDEVHDNIIKKYGSTEVYLCEACGIEQDIIFKLKNMLLE